MLRLYQAVSAHKPHIARMPCVPQLSLSPYLLSPEVCVNADRSVYRCVLRAAPIDKRYMPLSKCTPV